MNVLLTPKKICGAYAFLLAVLLLSQNHDWVFVVRGVAGYSVAFLLSVSVAREHREGSWLRFAWMAFALNSAASVVRHVADTPLWDQIWPAYSGGVEIAVIRQTAIVIGLSALLAGVVAMVWAFHSMGIGLSPLRRDIAAILGVFAVLATIMYYREGLAEANSPSALARHLQQIGLILLAAGAACSILVYRLARQMSGGRFATTMLYIVVYTVLRCVLVCFSLFPSVWTLLQPVLLPLDLAVPFLFALAAAYRSGIAMHGVSQIPKSSPVSSRLQQTFPA